MAERGRLLIVLLAVLIISSLIPHSNAERTDSNAIEIQINEKAFWGIGINSNTVAASFEAIVSGINKSMG